MDIFKYLQTRAEAIQVEGVKIEVREVKRMHPICIVINNGDEMTFEEVNTADGYLQGIADALKALRSVEPKEIKEENSVSAYISTLNTAHAEKLLEYAETLGLKGTKEVLSEANARSQVTIELVEGRQAKKLDAFEWQIATATSVEEIEDLYARHNLKRGV